MIFISSANTTCDNMAYRSFRSEKCSARGVRKVTTGIIYLQPGGHNVLIGFLKTPLWDLCILDLFSPTWLHPFASLRDQLSCSSQAFIATLLFNPSMSALSSMVTLDSSIDSTKFLDRVAGCSSWTEFQVRNQWILVVGSTPRIAPRGLEQAPGGCVSANTPQKIMQNFRHGKNEISGCGVHLTNCPKEAQTSSRRLFLCNDAFENPAEFQKLKKWDFRLWGPPHELPQGSRNELQEVVSLQRST